MNYAIVYNSTVCVASGLPAPLLVARIGFGSICKFSVCLHTQRFVGEFVMTEGRNPAVVAGLLSGLVLVASQHLRMPYR